MPGRVSAGVDRRDIECAEIHRDPAQQRNALAADKAAAALAQRAQPAVGVADRDRRDAAGRLPSRARHRSQPTPRCQFHAICMILAGKPHDRAQRIGAARQRVDAVQRRPRAHQIEMIAALRERCRRRPRGSPARRANAPRRRRSGRAAAAFSGCSGSSAQARWLITARQAIGGRVLDKARQTRAASDRAAPSRYRRAGWRARTALPDPPPLRAERVARSVAHSAIWPGSLSTGIRSCATNSAAVPGNGPFSTAISGAVARAPGAARCPRRASRQKTAGSRTPPARAPPAPRRARRRWP